MVIRGGTDQAVAGTDLAGDSHVAVSPSNRPRIGCRSVVPLGNTHQIVTVVERQQQTAHFVPSRGADEAVRSADHAGASRAAIPPSNRPRIGCCAIVPILVVDHKIAVAERRHTVPPYLIVGRGTDEAVSGADHANRAGATVSPSNRPRIGFGAVGPVGAADEIVAVGERRHAGGSHPVIRGRTDDAVSRADHAANSSGAVAPRSRAHIGIRSVVPKGTGDDIVAVAERRHLSVADTVTRTRTDEAVSGADHAGNSRGAVAPGNRPHIGFGVAAPAGAADDIVAVGEGRHADTADIVIRLRADEAVAGVDLTAESDAAIDPGSRPDIPYLPVVPATGRDHKVAVAKRRYLGAADTVSFLGTDQAVAGAYLATDSRAGIGPGNGSCLVFRSVGPVGEAEDIVAVAEQCRGVDADVVVRGRTDEAVAGAYLTANSGATVGPGNCPSPDLRTVGPEVAADDIVTVAENRHAEVADAVIRLGTDETVAGADHAADSCAAVAPGSRPCVDHRTVVPVGTEDDIVAIGEHRHIGVADAVIRRGTDQTVAGADHAADSRAAVAPGYRTGVGCRTVVPMGALDHIVTVGKPPHAQATDPVIVARS